MFGKYREFWKVLEPIKALQAYRMGIHIFAFFQRAIFSKNDFRMQCVLNSSNCKLYNCVKSVHIRIYSGPHFFRHFPALGLNTERYSVSVRMRENAGKMRSRIWTLFMLFTQLMWIYSKSMNNLKIKVYERVLKEYPKNMIELKTL